jgi:hypothetical protein
MDKEEVEFLTKEIEPIIIRKTLGMTMDFGEVKCEVEICLN